MGDGPGMEEDGRMRACRGIMGKGDKKVRVLCYTHVSPGEKPLHLIADLLRWQARIAQRCLMRWTPCMLREIPLVGMNFL
jgi:hypothetical protein